MKETIRLYHARMVSGLCGDIKGFAPGETFWGEVWLEGDTVTRVLPASSEEASKQSFFGQAFTKEINCEGNLLLPGFKNAHTHSAMTFLRSYAEDLPLQRWLTEAVFPLEAKLTPEDVYDFAKLAILEYLASGITACFDMYHLAEATVQASVDCGFRTVVCGNINDGTGTVQENETQLRKQREAWKHPLISFQLGCHAQYTCGDAQLEMLQRLVREWQTPFYTHMSETHAEVENCKAQYGMSPLALFDQYGLFDWGGGIFHGVWPESGDLDIIKQRGIYVVSNPASNLKLASGIAPLQLYLDEKIPVALGTDGAASNNALSMFREMYLAGVLQRVKLGDAAAKPTAYQVLEMATVQGARCMGLQDCDALAPGKKADLVLVDLHKPNMQPTKEAVKNLVYCADTSNVVMTMIGGVIRYERGRYHIGEVPEEIYRRVEKRKEQLLCQ